METGNDTSRSPVLLANYLEMYDKGEVEIKNAKLNGVEDGLLSEMYNRMLSNESTRLVVKPSRLPDMNAVYAGLPNFGEVLDDIKRQLALCIDSPDGLEITPICLLGEPGIGKTHFASQLSGLLGTTMGLISMSQMTAGWLLSGSSSQWKGAKPGKVFEHLIEGNYANPVLVVDEIDKAGQGMQYDPLGSLYSLLEHDTAKKFTDEFVGVAIDASRVVWVSTANDERYIPKPILSRMNVYTVEKPTIDQARTIAINLYASLRNGHSWGAYFESEPNSDLLDVLAEIGPRDMRKALRDAFGNAKLENATKVVPAHIPSRSNKKTSIGFTN